MCISTNALLREEKIRAYWIVEGLDISSSIGASWNVSVVRARAQLDPNDLLPCSPGIWELPEFHAPLVPDITSPTALWVSLNTKCLVYIHLFFQTTYDLKDPQDRVRWETDADAVNTRLVTWRQEYTKDTLQALEHANAFIRGTSSDPDLFVISCTYDALVDCLQSLHTIPMTNFGLVPSSSSTKD